jgi:mannose-1-phosphate guanylyltransferase
MAVRAILLAGGLGTRLHPLTEELPKPMVPVLGRPWLDRLVEWLAAHGITEITLSLRHGKEVVMDHFREPPSGVEIRFAVEPQPLGTGGAIRYAAGQDPAETLLILNADIVQTFDLSSFLQFHRERNAQVTIGLIEVEDPSAYGAVELDGDGMIRKFIEKPRPGETESRWVNAGIYAFDPGVLSYIPEGREVSVERETFPALLAAGVRVYGCPCRGYWKDIGTRDRYLALHRDILDGRCPIPVPGHAQGPAIWKAEGVVVADSAHLVPPVFLGPGTVVEEGARVGPWVVTGAGCRIGKGARVSEAVLWDRSTIGTGVVIRRSVLGYATGIAGGTVEDAMLAGRR